MFCVGSRTGEIRCIARDLPEPSPLASEILNARPYAFLDNAPLEERRTQAVYTRRASERAGGDGLGILDPAAIDKVQAEAWPKATNADELHDTLMLLGAMTSDEVAASVHHEKNGAAAEYLLKRARFRQSRDAIAGERENLLGRGRTTANAAACLSSRDDGSAIARRGRSQREDFGTRGCDSRIDSRPNGSVRPDNGSHLAEILDLTKTEVDAASAGVRSRRVCVARKISM